MSGRPEPAEEAPSTRDRIVEHVRKRIEKGELGPGDRLPGERDLAQEIGVSRPSVRSGLEALEAMGIVVSRRGAGTFIAEGPPDLGREPLSLMAALHGFTPEEMFQARRVLEVGIAGLAAENARPENVAAMAEEVTEMFASVSDPKAFLRHDVRFHRAVAAGCGNRVLAGLMEMVAAQFYELRRRTVDRARDLRASAEMHRAIFRAIRSHEPEAAREAMAEHLRRAQEGQLLEAERERASGAAGEPAGETPPPLTPPARGDEPGSR
jgi:GntR family transcriptional repressor for pyruvate dehydrogenase complex